MVIAAIAVDDFLVAAQTPATMDEFDEALKMKYNIKRLGKPRRYLGWHFNYGKDGSIALNQRLLIDQTLTHAGFMDANGKLTPYPVATTYHAPDENDHVLQESVDQYRQLVVELRYITDLTRPDIAFAVCRRGWRYRSPQKDIVES